MLPWTAQPLYVIDFEGGLASGVLEYGVVAVAGGKVGATKTRLCRPTGPVPAADTAIHGLGNDVLTHVATFSEDWEYFSGLREGGVLAAHFAGVEHALIRKSWAVPRPSPDFARPGRKVADWGPWIDTARLAAHFHPQLSSKGLESVVAALGLSATLAEAAVELCPADRRRYHCALHDAIASALILCALAVDPRAANLGLTEMLVFSSRDPKKIEGLVQERMFPD